AGCGASQSKSVRRLAELLRGSKLGIVLNNYLEEDGAIVFREACKLGCEGIVSKRLGLPYRSGRSKYWVTPKRQQSGERPRRIGAARPLIRPRRSYGTSVNSLSRTTRSCVSYALLTRYSNSP